MIKHGYGSIEPHAPKIGASPAVSPKLIRVMESLFVKGISFGVVGLCLVVFADFKLLPLIVIFSLIVVMQTSFVAITADKPKEVVQHDPDWLILAKDNFARGKIGVKEFEEALSRKSISPVVQVTEDMLAGTNSREINPGAVAYYTRPLGDKRMTVDGRTEVWTGDHWVQMGSAVNHTQEIFDPYNLFRTDLAAPPKSTAFLAWEHNQDLKRKFAMQDANLAKVKYDLAKKMYTPV